MFRFALVDVLFSLLLLPALGLLTWLGFRTRRRALDRFIDSPLLVKLSQSVNHAGRRAKMLLVFVALGLSLVALARPQFGTRVETVRSQGRDVLVALDVSASMLAEDLAPNRLERARLEIARLIRGLDGDRIGLVAFAGDAFLQSPLTLDYGAALMFLASMDTDMIPIQGTDLGRALEVSLDAFEESAGEGVKVLVLMTDGEDHEGEIDASLQRARQLGVEINTVGIGSPEGVPIPEFDAGGRPRGFMRDEDGNVVTTRLEEGPLRMIAQQTGGRYVPVYGGVQALQDLVDEIALGRGRELESRQITQFEEQFQLFLALAIVLLFAETLIPDRTKRREAWSGRFQ